MYRSLGTRTRRSRTSRHCTVPIMGTAPRVVGRGATSGGSRREAPEACVTRDNRYICPIGYACSVFAQFSLLVYSLDPAFGFTVNSQAQLATAPSANSNTQQSTATLHSYPVHNNQHRARASPARRRRVVSGSLITRAKILASVTWSHRPDEPFGRAVCQARESRRSQLTHVTSSGS